MTKEAIRELLEGLDNEYRGDRASHALCPEAAELIRHLLSVNEGLSEALKVFDTANFFFEGEADDRVVSIGRWTQDEIPSFYADLQVFVGDFRRARAALEAA